ncbi:hypothetical protein TYRP_017653 [Tyrophagus putrescentiae]|nr:hypothetical protein TYRP_017653 [Tyrophagus putrescentiae]
MGIGGAGVLQVTQQPGLPRRTLTEEGADAVVAGGAVEAGLVGAVVDVLAAGGAGPAVDADAGEAAVGVGAGGAILADMGAEGALVDVLRAVGAAEVGRTGAGVGVDAVDAAAAVLTEVAAAVVDVDLAVVPGEASRTDALVRRGAVVGHAISATETGVHLTGHVAGLAELPGVVLLAVAPVRAGRVDADAVLVAGLGGALLGALVNVLAAGRSPEAGRTVAGVADQSQKQTWLFRWSLSASSQRGPRQPGAHWHSKLSTSPFSTQRPPFSQGRVCRQTLGSSTSQRLAEKPSGQRHLKVGGEWGEVMV